MHRLLRWTFVVAMLAAATAADALDKAPLLVQVQSGKGAAAPGNAEPADFLVVVTRNGVAVTGIAQAGFQIVNHFGIPGQQCGFTNNIVSFTDVGNGSYHLQVVLSCGTWAAGDNLAQVLVFARAGRGQAAATLRVY
jgi:hypothetical protein